MKRFLQEDMSMSDIKRAIRNLNKKNNDNTLIIICMSAVILIAAIAIIVTKLVKRHDYCDNWFDDCEYDDDDYEYDYDDDCDDDCDCHSGNCDENGCYYVDEDDFEE